jgi:hypothetical protein
LATTGPFTLFPENRAGNAVYLNNRLVISLPGRLLTYVLPLPQGGRFVYLSRDEGGQTQLGVYLPPSDPAPRVTEVKEGFYHAVMSIAGVVYKKFYRVVDNATIVDLLPGSKTADGLVGGGPGIVFYHVASMSNLPGNGPTRQQFGMVVHLMLYEEDTPRNLNFIINNALPRLKLQWLDNTRIQYRLTDGTTDVLSISQFQ